MSLFSMEQQFRPKWHCWFWVLAWFSRMVLAEDIAKINAGGRIRPDCNRHWVGVEIVKAK